MFKYLCDWNGVSKAVINQGPDFESDFVNMKKKLRFDQTSQFNDNLKFTRPTFPIILPVNV